MITDVKFKLDGVAGAGITNTGLFQIRNSFAFGNGTSPYTSSDYGQVGTDVYYDGTDQDWELYITGTPLTLSNSARNFADTNRYLNVVLGITQTFPGVGGILLPFFEEKQKERGAMLLEVTSEPPVSMLNVNGIDGINIEKINNIDVADIEKLNGVLTG